jgi:hypothetical protein
MNALLLSIFLGTDIFGKILNVKTQFKKNAYNLLMSSLSYSFYPTECTDMSVSSSLLVINLQTLPKRYIARL